MFNNIYQIAKKPISEKEYITADSFSNHNFVGRIADRVEIAVDRKYEIEKLAEWAAENRLGKIEGCTLILSGNMLSSKYFYERYKRFKKAVMSLCAVDEKQFMEFSDVFELIFTISDQFNDEYATYIYQEGDELITMDEFLRTAKADTPYYIGGVCIYHH